jgi:hypothetical protein
VRRYTPQEIEALTNWDGLLRKPPFEGVADMRQYYSRYITRMLWQAFSAQDWRNVAAVIDDLRVSEKLKRTTRFLLQRHLKMS